MNQKNTKKCVNCGKDFVYNSGVQKFCNLYCKREGQRQVKKERQAKSARKIHDEKSSQTDDKIQCLICRRWFKQVGSHVVQAHGFATARRYREAFGLDVKRGLTTGAYYLQKSNKVFENGTVDNLKAGAKYRFVKNDKKAGRYERSEQTICRLKHYNVKEFIY